MVLQDSIVVVCI